jgi:hypothetical protein
MKNKLRRLLNRLKGRREEKPALRRQSQVADRPTPIGREVKQ